MNVKQKAILMTVLLVASTIFLGTLISYALKDYKDGKTIALLTLLVVVIFIYLIYSTYGGKYERMDYLR